MVDENYPWDLTHVEWVKLQTLWRNGDLKFTSSEVVAPDDFMGGKLFPPLGVANPVGTSNSRIKKRRTTEYAIGSWLELNKLQTARLLYPFLGKCVTTEATPNVHAISVGTSQNPLAMGRHLERENETSAESDRTDMMGMLPVTLHMECTELTPLAIQSSLWRIARILPQLAGDGAIDDIDKPTGISETPFQWSDFTFPTFTYNSETIEATIRGWSFDVTNEVFWRAPDANKYFLIGKIGQLLDLSVTLNLVPTGKNLVELLKTITLEDYLTDVDLVVKPARDAATDYIQWTHDKLYCSPFDIVTASRDSWYEGYMVTFHQLDTGSLAVESKDAYNKSYYEVT